VHLQSGCIPCAVEGKAGKDMVLFLRLLRRKSPSLDSITMEMSASHIIAHCTAFLSKVLDIARDVKLPAPGRLFQAGNG